MKKSLLAIVFLSLVSFVFAQDPVAAPIWKISLSEQSPEVGQEVQLVFEVDFEEGWHLYGSEFDPTCGPIVTSVSWEKVKGANVIGKLLSPTAKKKFDEIFECDITVFDKKARFTQKIKITDKKVAFDGIFECQICQDNGMCIPFDGKLLYSFKAKEVKTISTGDSKAAPKETKENSATTVVSDCDTCCAYIAEELRALKQSGVSNSITEVSVASGNWQCDLPRRAGWDDIRVDRVDQEETQDAGWGELLLFLFGAFLSGLIALMTPCVFPMIPMTVTFFTKSSKTRAQGISNAIIYGLFIILIYTLIGVLISKIAGPGFATEMATNWIINMVFFAIFILFSLSFLGLFEITLPSSFINKMDSNSDKGGLIGIFFMAFTIVLVSFSCTGPIVSSILVFSADGQWLKPILGMFGYSLAFALPFGLFAAFPGWLNSLPKSGGWLNEVKVTLGLLELAFALKFLSQADQVEGWNLLDREVFLSIWIAVFFLVGIYLMGKFRMKSDSPLEKLGVFRLLVIVATFSFTVYMTPGLWGAPLKFLSGMLPPPSTQDFDLLRSIREANGNTGEICDDPLYADELHLPHGLQGYYDLRQAICCAKEQGKPIFLDYTGKACANCREMEQKVWSDPKVLQRLEEDFVVLALYGDYNKIKLPENEYYTKSDGEKITTIGKANADFMFSKFKRQGQPFYMLIGVDTEASTESEIVLKELAPAHSFNKNIDEFVDFLDRGKDQYTVQIK